MATLAQQPRFQTGSDNRFFLISAFVMAAIVVAGFSLQFAMGRSSFSAPPLVHAHGIIFMGWVGIYVLQNVFAATGNRAMHKRLGWLATGWMALMLVLGFLITLVMVQNGRAPFFFQPQLFLILNPLTLLAFIALSGSAIAMRRRTDWHRRLHFCGMAILLGPAFGRLLPMPLLIPYAFEAVLFVTMLFPIAGAIADLRRTGRIHPAWLWGISAFLLTLLVGEAITNSAAGEQIYRVATAGTPGASVPGMAFPPPPPMPPAG
jgi:hypothetical protein